MSLKNVADGYVRDHANEAYFKVLKEDVMHEKVENAVKNYLKHRFTSHELRKTKSRF